MLDVSTAECHCLRKTVAVRRSNHSLIQVAFVMFTGDFSSNDYWIIYPIERYASDSHFIGGHSEPYNPFGYSLSLLI